MTGTAVVLYRAGEELEADRAALLLRAVQSQLASVDTVEHAKDISDQAAALLAYAKRARLGLEIQNRSACLRLAAERQAGILLDRMERLKGRPAKDSLVERLSTKGISYNQSYRWRTLARLSDDALELMRRECDRFGDELTTNYVMRQLRSKLGPEAYSKLVRPWESWEDRPYDKQVYDAINHLYRSLPAVLKADGDADKHLGVVLRDESYLFDYQLEQLRDILAALRTRVDRWLTATQRRLDGYAPEPPHDGPGLLAFVRESVAGRGSQRKQGRAKRQT